VTQYARRSVLLACLTLPVTGAGRRRRIPPGDESPADPAFAAFLARLRKAASARDSRGIQALCAAGLTVAAEHVPELQKVLGMGAARFDKGYCLPYIHGKFPEDLDPYEHAIVTKAGAALLHKPDGRPVAELDFDIVRVPQWRPDAKWQRVERLDGVAGYVPEDSLRTLGHFHAYCERRGGAWKLIAFDEGD
jgi:hypothetical protein